MATLLRSCGLLLLLLSIQAGAVRVDDFGAIGDGVALDHGAIQRAISAAGPGGTVEFTAGRTYVQCRQLVPMAGQTFLGNGAVLKRCDAPLAVLLVDAQAGDTAIVVDRPEVFELNQYVTPVKGSGAFADGESLVYHALLSKAGNTLTFNQGLRQAYPAGSLVTAVLDQINAQGSIPDVSIDGLVFEGNRTTNRAFLSWTRSNSLRTASGSTVRNCVFRNVPSTAITAYGTNVLIDGNRFENLDGPIVHLSGNDPIGNSTVTISNNSAIRTNEDAARMAHSEGVITVSRHNNSIRVFANDVRHADVPFIANLHEDMRDWIVSNNVVHDTAGIFWARNSIGPPLEQIEFIDNLFVNVGQSITLRAAVGDPIREFVFRNNRVIGGTLRFEGLVDATIADNTIKSCDSEPLTVTASSNVVVEQNVLSDAYCVLSVTAHGLIDEISRDVDYRIDVRNAADPADTGAVEGVTVTSVELSGSTRTPLCAPALPATIALGESLVCSLGVPASETGGEPISAVFAARGATRAGNAVANRGSATTSIRDRTPPTITLRGTDPVDLEFGDSYVEPGATAVDARDGDVTDSIVISTNLNLSRPGLYEATYRAADSAGNTAEARRSIRVIDRVPPSLVLMGPNPQVMVERSSYVELGAVATDNADGDISAAIRIDASGVDTSLPGQYFVLYEVTDSSGNSAPAFTRIVVVEKRESGGGAVGAEVVLLLLVMFGKLACRYTTRHPPLTK